MPTGSELFAGTLAQLGIREIFTLVGDHLNEALAAVSRAGISIYHFRHESGAAHAADAWARLNRRPAVCLVTGGPGHTNAITGIATAHLAGSPLIAISGSRSNLLAERQAFQDIDQVGITRPVVKWAAEVPVPSQIPFYLRRAFSEANSGRKGAVHLNVPVNVFGGVAEGGIGSGPGAALAASLPNSDDTGRAMDLLRNAERPAIIAGSGVWWSDAGQSLSRFIEHTSLPLYTITMARGVVPDDHPLCFGYADPALNRGAWRAFQEADVILVLGKRIDYRLALGTPRLLPGAAKVIQVDIHAQELGMNRSLEVGMCADAKTALQALREAAGEPPWEPRPWLDRLRQLREEWQQQMEEAAAIRQSPMHPAAFYGELRKALPENVLYSWDGGDFAHWGRAMLEARQAGGWVRLGPLGTIGSALPNALSLQLANPGRPVAMITGDGALGFYLAELDTLVRYGIPVVIIVGNDGGWGLERELQKEAYGMDETIACELMRTRYDVVMKGFGGDGETISELDQVGPAVRRAFSAGKPYLLNAQIQGTRSPFTDWQIAGKRK